MKSKLKVLIGLYFLLYPLASLAQERQWVEGFEEVEFYYRLTKPNSSHDFRGTGNGYMTAGWWADGQMENNILSWKTAIVPTKKPTTFAFIGSSAVLPSELSRGPLVKLSINGKSAVTFNIGVTRDYVWEEGDFKLEYISKRIEFPYFSTHRQFELNGNSGIYHLSVPASAIDAGNSAVIEVQILPNEQWNNGWFMIRDHKDVLSSSMEDLKFEMEVLRKDLAVLGEQTHILATKLYSNLLGSSGFEHSVIYSNEFRHLHPADLIKLENGELLITTREGTEHISRDGDVIMLRSTDGGKTWGKKQVIASIKNVDEREGCGIQLKDGTIVMGIFFNNLYTEDGSYTPAGKEKEDKLVSQDQRYLGSYFIISEDNGHTWSDPYYIDTKEMPFTNIEGPTDAPIEMPDGSLIMGLIGYSPKGDRGNRSSVLVRSTDKGKSWEYVSTMASDPGGKLGGFMEPGIVRTKTGRIIAGLRNHGPDQAVYVTYSDDDGKTWVPAWKTEMIGSPVDLIELSDGRIMATYGVRPPRHASPGGIRACFSSDNGETWNVSTEVQLRNDFLNWDIGYPESMQLEDGTILTVYYYNLFGKYYLGGTSWSPETTDNTLGLK